MSFALSSQKKRVKQIRKKGTRILNRQWRSLTAPIRLLPNFLIIGAMKCGTTSLFHYLKQHPCIAPPLKKEVHFFDGNYDKGVNWYRTHFPTFCYAHYVERASGQVLITGEASPHYLFDPRVPKRVFDKVPCVKLVVLLRNPVDRAYSHYHHWLRIGIESLPFEKALEAEPERLAGEVEKMMADENYVSFNHGNFSYLSRGIYVDQLRAWTAYFPNEQILILRSEDFYSDPYAVFREVLAFLDLPDWKLNNCRRFNAGSYPEMPVMTRKKMVDYFAPHNQRLYEFLGTDFGWDR